MFTFNERFLYQYTCSIDFSVQEIKKQKSISNEQQIRIIRRIKNTISQLSNNQVMYSLRTMALAWRNSSIHQKFALYIIFMFFNGLL
jgi:hypothetical protein